MKILHFTSGALNGGAARGAYVLHQRLRMLGVDSMFVSSGRNNPDEEGLLNLNDSFLKSLKFSFLSGRGGLAKALYFRRSPSLFSGGMGGIDLTQLKEYRDADIIHLHWITGMVSLKSIKKIDKPLVWTLRDMWPFTGGCHYSMDCDRYKKSCGGCPQLGSNREEDLSRTNFDKKKNLLPADIRPIGISKWITACANQSPIFEGVGVETIYNNIDIEVFFPDDKVSLREKLAIPRGSKVILIGANSVKDFYKGFDLFSKALDYLPAQDTIIVAFGRTPISLHEAKGIRVLNLGFVNSDERLREIYSAADVFVAPSRMDAFGKTVAEALACGTPVVCFDTCGPSEIVVHKVTGYKASAFDSVDLAKGISWVLEQNQEVSARMRSASINRVRKHFNSEIIAKQYLGLYREMLGVG